MLLSVLWYLGALLGLAGALGLIRPMRWLWMPTRRRAATVMLSGVVLTFTVLVIGTGTRRIDTPASLLDRVCPAFQFNEVHAIEIAAPAARVYTAMVEVTAGEITGYRTLAWIRCLGQCTGESLLNPPDRAPILATALKSGFRTLAESPNEELVFGTFVAAPAGAARREWSLDAYVGLTEPGYAKAVMNFRLRSAGEGRTRLETETRVFATDPHTLLLFTGYWRTILPGSSLIRIAWLRAIKRRSE